MDRPPTEEYIPRYWELSDYESSEWSDGIWDEWILHSSVKLNNKKVSDLDQASHSSDNLQIVRAAGFIFAYLIS